VSLVTAQSYFLSLLDQLPMPYGKPAARAFITPPDPRVEAKIPAIYIWPSDGDENRSADLGGTIPRNTGVGTSSGYKGMMHRMDVYITWFSTGSGTQQDPIFPAMVDAVMAALRYSLPNPVQMTDPNTKLVWTIYNVGEDMSYRTGMASTADERQKRYDALITCSVWEIVNA
jgi:hypothetical protein